MNDVISNQFPKFPHTGSEHHGSDVCFKCYDQHIDAQIDTKGSDHVSCPQCSQTLEEPEVRKLARRIATYQKYIDGAAKKCMQQDEEFHACPNAACSWGAFFAKDDGNIFNCQLCKARYCLSCEVPFHEGLLCEEYQSAVEQHLKEEANEQTSRETIQQISKKCPSASCGVNIQKHGGCDHITCGVCNHEFCWRCFAPYRGPNGVMKMGNDAHQSSCRYAPGNLPNADSDEEDELEPEDEDEDSEEDSGEDSDEDENDAETEAERLAEPAEQWADYLQEEAREVAEFQSSS